MGFPKNIAVFDGPNKQKQPFSYPNFGPVIGHDQVQALKCRGGFSTADYKTGRQFYRILSDFHWQTIDGSHFRFDFGQNCGRFPVVFERKLDFDNIPSVGDDVWLSCMSDLWGQKYISALDARKGLCCRFSRVSGLVSDQGCVDKCGTLQYANENQQDIKQGGVPIFRRLFLAIFLNLAGYGIAVWGIGYFNDQRRGMRAAFMIGGWLLCSLGFVLIWLTDFPLTWGWLL